MQARISPNLKASENFPLLANRMGGDRKKDSDDNFKDNYNQHQEQQSGNHRACGTWIHSFVTLPTGPALVADMETIITGMRERLIIGIA